MEQAQEWNMKQQETKANERGREREREREREIRAKIN